MKNNLGIAAAMMGPENDPSQVLNRTPGMFLSGTKRIGQRLET